MGRLVIGIGNPLRGDDGVGWHLAGTLADRSDRTDPSDLTALMVHQLTPELAADLVDRSGVLFIDAWLAAAADPAGAARPQLRPVPSAATGPGSGSHHLEPGALVALADLLFDSRPAATILLVPAFAFPHGPAMSPSQRALLPEARRLLHTWLDHSLA
ncbi:hydrogenase maturation protease [Synechococcus sp. Cruz-9H2]|uniref:hydrogenase maturation protease n=1 Tax=unclassified Synechococcus TaxID=2626047 RepID=UPI0020CF01EF|nr:MULTISPECIES: hydrogenase maturation protease [unclassified Synechococcus]MCP9820418.1 hydrogenase maturation protease [Synechococcus sp. Cruz-9H2]MCP9871322.1 hydrogenase maturation protease [Synechococcus sp. Cruz-7B9]